MAFGNNFHKGIFTPTNHHKYKGDSSNIIYRSSWELKLMNYLDNNPNVIWWASEEMPIKYISPVDDKIHRYYPDFIAKMKKRDGSEVVYMIEVKPYKQTLQPVKRRKTKRYINECVTYTINQAKWRAADLFCKENNMVFRIITEKELGIKH